MQFFLFSFSNGRNLKDRKMPSNSLLNVNSNRLFFFALPYLTVPKFKLMHCVNKWFYKKVVFFFLLFLGKRGGEGGGLWLCMANYFYFNCILYFSTYAVPFCDVHTRSLHGPSPRLDKRDSNRPCWWGTTEIKTFFFFLGASLSQCCKWISAQHKN